MLVDPFMTCSYEARKFQYQLIRMTTKFFKRGRGVVDRQVQGYTCEISSHIRFETSQDSDVPSFVAYTCETSHVTSDYNKYGARLERTFRQLNLPAFVPNRPKISHIGDEEAELTR